MTKHDVDNDHLSTPTLDTETPNLLQILTKHGGYAYVSISTLASTGDLNAAETAHDMAWEQLHTGPWHSVLPIWRDAYSMSCLQVAKVHYKSGNWSEAIRVLDLGLIMGGALLRDDLNSAIETITKRSRGYAKGEVHDEEKIVGCSSKSSPREAEEVLPKRSLSSEIVKKTSALSLERFLCDHLLSGSPVILRDCMDHWPATKKWKDMDYLKGVAGDRTVPVEVGKNYLCSEWKQELITFSQFLERIKSNERSPMGPTYLAQHPLFDQIQELRKDILIPDYCFVGGGELRSLNSWFGPAGTVTPLHHDPHHNILAQVVGRKYIRLYPASISEGLYPYTESMLSNSSQGRVDPNMLSPLELDLPLD
ncbi:hypothetical protein GIB67_018129 [Kingdonia uniflora]|uniref:JmjC domain-containing protein n=1 Tax=Kingdonia uniflora TaxID=39325 RepID=A0A7J7NM61_9MAGN|nr:hypothetical protein GIB67_018129 [Kingdonia uniflora]